MMGGISPCIPDRITNTKCHINSFVSPDDGHMVAQNMERLINITKNKLCTRLALFTRLYRDARSTKHNI
jgi:hypothetical protein